MELVFNTDEHGFSLTHFFQRVKDKGPTLILIEDTKANVTLDKIRFYLIG